MRLGGEALRNTLEALEPDPRLKHVVVLIEGGRTRPYTLDDRHASLGNITLNEAVPNDAWVHFETARNLWLYSWFVYRFQSVAELQALASLEFALRLRFEREGRPVPRGLRKLLLAAVGNRWIDPSLTTEYREIEARRRERDEAIQAYAHRQPLPQLDPDAYLRQIVDALPSLRNEWAHGSELLMGHGLSVLALCADLINQLFPSGSGDTA